MKISRDTNGNKILQVQKSDLNGGRGFRVQTCGTMPETHRKGICQATENELRRYVRDFGTVRQREALNID